MRTQHIADSYLRAVGSARKDKLAALADLSRADEARLWRALAQSSEATERKPYDVRLHERIITIGKFAEELVNG